MEILLDIERWRPVEGFEGLYEISNHGRVKSMHKIQCQKKGEFEFIRNPIKPSHGYFAVGLIGVGRRAYITRTRIHRLVGKAFIPNPENKPQINHKDGNKLNNHFSNLEWVTAKENSDHAMLIGLKKSVSPENIIAIKKMRNDGISMREISDQLKVSTGFICKISKQKSRNL